jgi:hypothetical protein
LAGQRRISSMTVLPFHMERQTGVRMHIHALMRRGSPATCPSPHRPASLGFLV